MLFTGRWKQKAALLIKYSRKIAGPAHVFCNPFVTMEKEDRGTGQAIVKPDDEVRQSLDGEVSETLHNREDKRYS